MKSAPEARLWVAGAAALLACAGCGFKGPLYLPEHNATVVTRPSQAGQAAPAASQAQNPNSKDKSKTSSSPPSAPPSPSSLPQSPPPQ